MTAQRVPRPHDDPTRDALRAIYHADANEGADPALSDFTRLAHRVPRSRRARLLIIFFAFFGVAAALAVAGFLLFSPTHRFSGKSVVLTLAAPADASSGDSVEWTLTVANHGTVDLKKVEANVQFPSGFTFVSSKPDATNEYHNAWSLHTVQAGSEKVITLHGKLLGDVGEKKLLTASVNYQPANFASTFVQNTSREVVLNTSTLDVDIQAPLSATSGQKVSYTITVTNNSKVPVDRVRLAVDYPATLSDVTQEPVASDSRQQWDQESLAPGKTFTVKLNGTVTGDPQSQVELKARVGVYDADATFHAQRERSALILILASTLNVGVTTNVTAADPGSIVKATVTYANDSDSVFSNATLTLSYAGTDSSNTAVSLIDGATKAKPAFVQSDTAQLLTWNKNTIPDLARLVPGANGSIEVTMPIKKSVRQQGDGKELAVRLIAKIQAADVDGTGSPFEKESAPVLVRMNTEVRLAVEGRYYTEEGFTVGSGPLPPSVGSETQYQISWFITNTMNSVTNTTVRAVLPAGVIFVRGSTASGTIAYDETSHQVTWSLDAVQPGVGQSLPTLEGVLTVAITPQANEVGTTPKLIGKTTFSGKDGFTGAQLSVSSDPVTTELPFDMQAKGKGTVIAAPAPDGNTNAANAINADATTPSLTPTP